MFAKFIALFFNVVLLLQAGPPWDLDVSYPV